MNRSTIILLAILAILGGSYWFYFRNNEINYANDGSTSTPPPQTNVSEVKTDKIKTLEWNQGTTSAQIRQFELGKWEFVNPVTLQLDNQKAISLAESIENLSGAPKISLSELSLKDAGLENPYAKVIITKDDGSQETILFGSTSVDGGSRYVHRQGSDHIVLVFTYKIDSLLQTPTELTPEPSPSPDVSQ